MKFFILAGGYGKRARPLSLVKPKPAFPLHGVPLVKLLLGQLEQMGFKQGFINLHYKPEAIRESIGLMPGIAIDYLYEEELSGSRILTRALDGIADEQEFLFILNGDVFMEISQIPIAEMVQELKETGCDGGLLLRKSNHASYAAVHTEDGFFRGTGESNNRDSLMYTGAALFRRKIIEKIVDINFFQTLARHSFKIKTFVYDGIWLDIGNPRLYFEANTQYKQYIRMDSQANSISENVVISPDSRVVNCIAWENTEITGGSVLSNCIITGNISLHNAYYSDKIIYAQDAAVTIGEFA
ncbi:MAG: mannose-phosphate guanylyltransferase [Acidobacteriota bacterium]|nr:mannose-phosphate guanylyltransferase [Acidobacteriota bacterium]